MRLFIITIAFFCLTTSLKAQHKLKEDKDVDYKTVVSNLTSFKIYKLKNQIINVYIFDNGSGSANLEGSDEVSLSLLISKSEYGEAETPKFYTIKSLINFKIISVGENAVIIKDNLKNRKIKYEFE